MYFFDKKIPLKTRQPRANQVHYMTKELIRPVTTRSRLINFYLRAKTQLEQKRYNKRRNFCLKLLRKASRIFYSILDLKSITDNKTFRKTVKPFFLDKQVPSSKTTLITSNEIIHDVKKVLNIFNFFFSNVVKYLNVKMHDNHLPNTKNLTDNTDVAIKM